MKPANAGQSLLDRIADPKKLRALGFYRILRVARTLADLDHRDMPSPEKVAPAIHWRDIAFLYTGRRGKNYVIWP